MINGAGSVLGTASARDWLRLLEAIERPTSSQRAHSAALTPFLGWTAARVAAADDDEWERVHQRLHHWARVLRAKGVAALAETITQVEGLPARVLAAVDGERRLTDLRHVAQLLHAAAADGAHGDDGADVVAAPAHRRGPAGDRRRGAQPAAGVRRRGGAGADDPPQQGARVPDRLLPGPVGGGLHPVRRSPDLLPRPRRGRRAHDRRRPGRPRLPRASEAAQDRAAGRGPAARLRRADARAASGRDLVGGLVGQPRLGARPADLRPRRRRQRAGERQRHAVRRCRHRPLRAARGERGGLHPRRALDARAADRLVGLAARARASSRPRGSTARSTGAGAGRPTATSPRAPTRRAWRASPRSRSSTTSRRRTAGAAALPSRGGEQHADALLGTPSLLAAMPVGMHVGTFVHDVLEAVDFAAPDLEPSSPATSPPRRLGASSTSAIRRSSGRACKP